MIKLIICDGDGTIGLPNPSKQLLNFIDFIKDNNIQIAVITNNIKSKVVKAFINANLDVPKIIITKNLIKKPKPAPEFIDKIVEVSGISKNHLILLGDDGKTDTLCAINSGILPLSINFSKSKKNQPYLKYGIPINTPDELLDWISTYGMQRAPYFGWQYNRDTCMETNTVIDVRALIGQMETEVNEALKRVLKFYKSDTLGSKNYFISYILFMYLVSQCYLSDLLSDIDIITVYPGHNKGSTNKVLKDYSSYLSLFFKDKFIDDLILRHTTAPKSTYQQSQRNILDQFNTIMINPDYKKKIQTKNILVLDDFTTTGFSLECARRMLLNAGVERVVGIAIAKYRSTHAVTRISKRWDSYTPSNFTTQDIKINNNRGQFNQSADDYFHRQVFDYYKNS